MPSRHHLALTAYEAARRERSCPLLAGCAVEQLAEHVEVAEVASGLLDEVEVDEAHRELSAAVVGADLVELAAGGNLSAPVDGVGVAGQVVLDRFFDGGVELPVRICVPVDLPLPGSGGLAGKVLGPPGVLDQRQVFHQTGDRRR